MLMALVAAAMVAVLALGAAFGATRAGLGVPEARRVGRTVVLVLGAWLAVTAALGMGGVLSASARPPSWPLLPLTAFAVIVVVTRSAAGNRVLSNIRLPGRSPPRRFASASSWPSSLSMLRGAPRYRSRSRAATSTCWSGSLHRGSDGS